ncbi:MAG: TRAP transporter substrate-binding protein DctP [Thalassovita sp.]
MARPFMELLAEETDGDLTVDYFGPDAVSSLEQVEPVQSGVFDIVFTHPAYHAGLSPLGVAIDGVGADPVKRREAGIIDFLDAHYQSLGLKLLAAPAAGSKGFRFYLKDQIASDLALDGMKLRATVSYQPMIEGLGGSVVVLPGGEVYSSLQRGVVDGAAWTLVGAYNYGWHEVAGYMTAPEFGQVGTMLLMNLDRYEGLSDKDKAALDRVAERLERTSIERFDALAEVEKTKLLGAGVQITSFGTDVDLDRLFAEGVWAVAAKGDAEAAAAFRELAKSAGLSD